MIRLEDLDPNSPAKICNCSRCGLLMLGWTQDPASFYGWERRMQVAHLYAGKPYCGTCILYVAYPNECAPMPKPNDEQIEEQLRHELAGRAV